MSECQSILDSLARRVWAKSHDGAECPPEATPTVSDLVSFLPAMPASGWRALSERFDAMDFRSVERTSVGKRRTFSALYFLASLAVRPRASVR